MLSRLRLLVLSSLALASLSAPAFAVDSTFSVTPTSGTVSLHIVWTDSVTLSDPSSTWTTAVLSGTNYSASTPFVVIAEIDIDDTSDCYHGGEISVPLLIEQVGVWDLGQVDSGLDPNSSPWWTGSQDIYVTVSPASGGDTPPGGGAG